MSSTHDCQSYHYYLPNGKKSYHNNITYLFEYHSSFYFQFYRSKNILSEVGFLPMPSFGHQHTKNVRRSNPLKFGTLERSIIFTFTQNSNKKVMVNTMVARFQKLCYEYRLRFYF